MQQWNQSDLAFLRERARLIQAEIWVENDRLCFKSRGNRTATSMTLVQGRDLLSVQVRADLAHQRTKVKVSGYDAAARDGIDEEAGVRQSRRRSPAAGPAPPCCEQAFGERISYRGT